MIRITPTTRLTSPAGRTPLAVWAALLLIAALPRLAAAQGPAIPRVGLVASPLFGEELLLPGKHVPLLITVDNRTSATFSGEVVVSVNHHAAGRRRYVAAVDLPGGEGRRVVLTPAVPEGSTLNISYRVDGRELASTTQHPGYSMATQGIVLLDNPSHLRSALLEMEIEEPPVDTYSSPRMVRVPLGTAPVDPRTMDPILPTNPAGWSAVRAIFASAPSFERLPSPERRAIVDWVRAGGELVLYLRSDADLRAPGLLPLLGPVEVVEAPRGESPAGLVPGDGPLRQLVGAGLRREIFGGSKRVGFGRVYAVTYEGTAPRFAAAPETRALVMAILARPRFPGTDRPAMSLGHVDDDIGFGGHRFDTLRPSLDPNESYRLALVLAALVLLLYVILIGPVNFHLVGKRGKPTLALVTTPAAATACLLVLLAVGYIGKGTRMRYRAVEIVEVVEGDREGPARRYSGLFLTRPATFDFPVAPRGVAFDVAATGRHPTAEAAGEGQVLRAFRGGLWETVFIREDHLADIGGQVLFEREGRRVVAVRNETDRDLRGAVMIDGLGTVYPIGDVAAGGRAPVSSTIAMNLRTDQAFWGPDDSAVGELANVMGLDFSHRRLLPGVATVFGGHLGVGKLPVLFAFVEIDRGEVADTFSAELDYAFIRVVPDLERGDR